MPFDHTTRSARAVVKTTTAEAPSGTTFSSMRAACAGSTMRKNPPSNQPVPFSRHIATISGVTSGANRAITSSGIGPAVVNPSIIGCPGTRRRAAARR